MIASIAFTAIVGVITNNKNLCRWSKDHDGVNDIDY